MKYKKILATVGSVLMLGATAAGAFAANYPAPFSHGDMVVVGANAASSDMTAAVSINSNLIGQIAPSTGSVVVGGDADKVQIKRSADEFNIGDSASDVFITSVNKDHLPVLLADSTLRGEDNEDYKYTQKIQLGNNLNLTHFRDYDYKQDEPTLGIYLDSSTPVLSYQIDFTTAPNMSDDVMRYTDLKILGKTYFVSELTTTSLTLLDSANSGILTEGEGPLNLGGYTIEAVGFTANDVRLKVNGKTTGALAKGAVYNIADDIYLGVKDYVPVQVERDARTVELVIGSGKLELINGSQVKLNDKNVRELTSTFTLTGTTLSSLAINWQTDKRAFITGDSKLTMPVFGSVDLAMTGMNFPEGEVVTVSGDGSRSARLAAPIRDGEATLNLLYTGSTVGNGFEGVGRDSNNALVTSAGTSLTFNETARDRNFVVSWMQGSESQTYLASATINEDSSNVPRVTIKNELTGNNFCSDVANGSTCTVGNVILTVTSVNATTGNIHATFSATANTFDRLYTSKGLRIMLPTVNDTATITLAAATSYASDAAACAALPINVLYTGSVVYNSTADLTDATDGSASCNNSVTLNLTESSSTNDARGAGKSFQVTLGVDGGTDSSRKVQVSTAATADKRIKDSDDYIGYVASDYATKVEYFTSGDQDNAKITYYGDEVSGNFWLTSGAVSVDEVGTMVATDAETAKIASKNLIVVGGSCINSVAADLLGGALCGEAFTASTGVGEGQFLIQSYAREGKVALLVAGYEADDTTKAATYLMNNAVDTAVGAKEIKSSTVVASTA